VSDFFEYDPITGIRTDTKWDENLQQMTLIRTADVEPILDHAKSMANDSSVSQDGIKKGWWQYASLPPIVILQMKAKGINVFDQNDQKKMFAEINEHYPHLKTTTKVEGRRSSAKIYNV
jgi:hypothetical protein